jgi:uncharacterized membrane protein
MFLSSPIFIILAGTGAIFIVAGLIMLQSPPRKINIWYGYRTSRSRQSQAHWDFAQRYSSKLMTRIGQILCIISVPAAFIRVDPQLGASLSVVIIVMCSIYLIVNTERAIKNKFSGK